MLHKRIVPSQVHLRSSTVTEGIDRILKPRGPSPSSDVLGCHDEGVAIFKFKKEIKNMRGTSFLSYGPAFTTRTETKQLLLKHNYSSSVTFKEMENLHTSVKTQDYRLIQSLVVVLFVSVYRCSPSTDFARPNQNK